MVFTLNGDKITQTEINVNLNGLENIDGVSIIYNNDLKEYHVEGRRISVEGTLNIKVGKEKLVSDKFSPSGTDDATLRVNGGTLNIDGFDIVNGVEIYSTQEVIRFNKITGNGANADLFGSTSKSGSKATINWNGGTIYGDGRMAFYGVDLNIKNGILDGNVKNRNIKRFGIRNNVKLNIDGFTLKKHNLNFMTPTDISDNIEIIQFKGFQAIGNSDSAVNNEQRKYGGLVELRDFESVGSDNEFSGWEGGGAGHIRTINGKSGSSFTYGSVYGDTDFGIQAFKEFKFELFEDNGNIENAKIYMKDYDDGNRHNIATGDYSGTPDFTPDRTYNWNTNNQGISETKQVLLSTMIGGLKTGVKSFRSKNLDDTDLFDFYIWSYNHELKIVELSGKDKGVLKYHDKLFIDIAITQTDSNIVAAYTGIDINHNTKTITISGGVFTPQMIYDYVKYDKVFLNIEKPNIKDLAITSSDGFTFTSNYIISVTADGTLNINPKTSKLITKTNTETALEIFGSVNIGSEGVDSLRVLGLVAYSSGTYDSTIDIKGDGRLNIYSSSVSLPTAGYIKVSSGLFTSKDSLIIGKPNGGGSASRVRVEGGSIDIENTKFKDTWLNYDNPSKATINGFTQDGVDGPEFNVDNINPTEPFVFKSYNGELAGAGGYYGRDAIAYGGAYVKVVNPWKGSAINVLIKNGQGSIEMLKEVKFNIKDDSGAVENAKIYSRGYIHRDIGIVTPKNLDPIDYDKFREYFFSSGVNGDTETKEILLSVVASTNTGNNFAYSTIDRRNKNNDETDIFEFDIWSYNHQLKKIELSLKEIGMLEVNEKLFMDTSITQNDKDIVSAYNGIDINHDTKIITISEDKNLSELYDYIKYDNVFINIGVPLIERCLLKVEGKILNFNDYSLVVDGAELSGSVRYSIIKTTGSITKKNEAKISAQYLKTNGKVDVLVRVKGGDGLHEDTAGVWLGSQGDNDRGGMISSNLTPEGDHQETIFELNPNTNYKLLADAVGAYRSNIVDFNTGDFGNPTPIITLQRIKTPTQNNILPDELSPQQQKIKNMIIYDAPTNTAQIKLNENYEADDRWDSENNIWNFTGDDFVSIAFAIEEFQSSRQALQAINTIVISEKKMTINITSTLSFSQHPSNINCIINMNAFTILKTGDNIQAKKYISHTNGVVLTNAGDPIIANIEGGFDSVSKSTIEKIESMIIETENGDNYQYSSVCLENAPTGGGTGGSGATPQEIWEYSNRNLTSPTGLTGPQEEKLNNINIELQNKENFKAVIPTEINSNIMKVNGVNVVLDDFKEKSDLSSVDENLEILKNKIDTIPINPLLADDERIDNLDKKISEVGIYDDTDLKNKIDTIPINTLLADDERIDNIDKKISEVGVYDDTDLKNKIDTIPINTLLADDERIDNIDKKISEVGMYDDTDLKNKIDTIPINPLLADDTRLDNLDKKISEIGMYDYTELKNKIDTIPTNPLLADDTRLDDLEHTQKVRLFDCPLIMGNTGDFFNFKEKSAKKMIIYFSLYKESFIDRVKDREVVFEITGSMPNNTDSRIGNIIGSIDYDKKFVLSFFPMDINRMFHTGVNYDNLKADIEIGWNTFACIFDTENKTHSIRKAIGRNIDIQKLEEVSSITAEENDGILFENEQIFLGPSNRRSFKNFGPEEMISGNSLDLIGKVNLRLWVDVDLENLKYQKNIFSIDNKIDTIPINPLLTTDERIDNLDKKISEIEYELKTKFDYPLFKGGYGDSSNIEIKRDDSSAIYINLITGDTYEDKIIVDVGGTLKIEIVHNEVTISSLRHGVFSKIMFCTEVELNSIKTILVIFNNDDDSISSYIGDGANKNINDLLLLSENNYWTDDKNWGGKINIFDCEAKFFVDVTSIEDLNKPIVHVVNNSKSVDENLEILKNKIDTIPINPLLADDTRLENLNTILTSIQNLNNLSAEEVWGYVNRGLSGLTNINITQHQYEKVAEEVSKAIINENDEQKVINAIVGAIGNTNINEISLVAMIRNDLERQTGAIKAIPINTLLATDTRIDNLDKKISEVEYDDTDLKNKIDTIPINPLLADDERIDNLDKKISEIGVYDDTDLKNKIDTIPTNPLLTTDERIDNLNNILTSIQNLNNLSAEEIWKYTDRTLNKIIDINITQHQYEKLAEEVSKAIISENDEQKVINAIVGAIGNTNINEISLVAMIRSDLERQTGAIKAIPINTLLADDKRIDNLDKKISEIDGHDGNLDYKEKLNSIDEGVDKASKLIPHTKSKNL